MRVLVLVALLALPCRALEILYDVATPLPTSHLFHMTMEIKGITGETIDLAMPAWTPGYYKIQNHVKNIRGFAVKGPDGKERSFEMTDKQTWRVKTAGATELTITYKVYAHNFSPTGSDLTDEHIYFHGTWIFLYVVNAIENPVTLQLHPPAGWKTATGLDFVGDNRYTAPDYDVLVDCPVLMGDLDIRTFTAGGVPHEVVIHKTPACDRAAMFEDIRKTVEAQLAIMGPPPYSRYVFLLHFPRWGGGGLEHANSTSIVHNGESMGDRNSYLRFMFVLSHEFFHTWNIKRIRPEQLGPFDYTKEVFTKNLWVHEGFTNYYGWLALQRAGILKRPEYLGYLQEELNNLWRREGRKITSPEMSSWHTWMDADDREDVEVSYYLSGDILGATLDGMIRTRTAGAKSLDDVMRLAYESTKKSGYGGDDWLSFVNKASGSDFTDFFRKYVSGTEDAPIAEALAALGISYEAHVDAVETDAGFDVHGVGEEIVKVTRVLDDSPAGIAGFDEGDLLLACEGKRLRAGTFWGWLRAKKPGDKVTFLIFRGERLLEKSVTLVEKKKISHLLKIVEKPTDDQKKLQDGWLK